MTQYGAGERSFMEDGTFIMVFAVCSSLDDSALVTELHLTHVEGGTTVIEHNLEDDTFSIVGGPVPRAHTLLSRLKDQYIGRAASEWRAGTRD